MLVNDVKVQSSLFANIVTWDGVFTAEEAKKIIDICEASELKKGTVLDSNKEHENRVSNINFHRPNDETAWIFERLNGFLNDVNNKFFGINLVGFDYFQFSTYDSKEAGHYDWHIDSALNLIDHSMHGLHRKLSLTILLNDDFEGGDFEVNTGLPETVPCLKGRAIVFPSFILHRVKPVTMGIRKSLVVWVLGERWK
jgi:PKHD-type hydroxylase